MKINIFVTKKYSSNYLELSLYLMLMFSSIMVIKSNSWINAWIFLEMNMMTFIPMMLNKCLLTKSINSMIKYFIVQAFSSSLLFMCFLTQSIFLKNLFLMDLNKIIIETCLTCSILIKLGASPFHWWMPQIMKTIDWKSCFLIMTWQKIAPLSLMIQFNFNNNLMINLTSILSMIIGAIMGLNQTSMKMILSFSSINHLGWILMNYLTNLNMMIFYFTIYSMMILPMTLFLNKFNLNYLKQIYSMNNKNYYNKIFLTTMLLSLGGIPPFLGFLPKMLTIINTLNNLMIMETMIMILSTLITLKFYTNIMISSLNLMNLNLKFNKNNKYMKFLLMIMFINMMMLYPMISLSKFTLL